MRSGSIWVQYAARASPFMCHGFISSVSSRPLWWSPSMSHPQQGLPRAISNREFHIVELRQRLYHARLCKWPTSPYLGLYVALCGELDLSWLGSLCPAAAKTQSVPFPPVLSIVEWMGPVFVREPNDKPRCPQKARRGKSMTQVSSKKLKLKGQFTPTSKWHIFRLPVALYIQLVCFVVSGWVLEISAVKMLTFFKIQWN